MRPTFWSSQAYDCFSAQRLIERWVCSLIFLKTLIGASTGPYFLTAGRTDPSYSSLPRKLTRHEEHTGLERYSCFP